MAHAAMVHPRPPVPRPDGVPSPRLYFEAGRRSLSGHEDRLNVAPDGRARRLSTLCGTIVPFRLAFSFMDHRDCRISPLAWKRRGRLSGAARALARLAREEDRQGCARCGDDPPDDPWLLGDCAADACRTGSSVRLPDAAGAALRGVSRGDRGGRADGRVAGHPASGDDRRAGRRGRRAHRRSAGVGAGPDVTLYPWTQSLRGLFGWDLSRLPQAGVASVPAIPTFV